MPAGHIRPSWANFSRSLRAERDRALAQLRAGLRPPAFRAALRRRLAAAREAFARALAAEAPKKRRFFF